MSSAVSRPGLRRSSTIAADADSRIRIRPAGADEAELLTDLSLRSKAFWGYDAGFLARCRAVMTVKARGIEAQPHYVADLAGRIAGFYGFESEAAGVGLDYLFVEPDLVGRGIGRALWRHAVATARAHGHSALIVVSDPNAEGFYLKMGCRHIGTRPSELEPGRQLPLLRFAL
ncbi:MAG TPA: GNAT family N-acetyltransferase [Candidatus Acidoferrum sp.]|nr:GNAT family N-acetyltransferase [Candidatus Acidoferrum sp.]